MIWEKAQHLYQEDQAKTMGSDFKGITATHKELREGGYFHTAKLIVLRNLYLQNKNPHSQEEPTSVSTKIHSSILKSVQQNKKQKRRKCQNLE